MIGRTSVPAGTSIARMNQDSLTKVKATRPRIAAP
jgi:hypothetical protein